MASRRFRNWYNTSPSDVADEDAFAVKLVAIAGTNNDYAVYAGRSDWSDEKVAANGDKVSEEQAGPFSYLMQLREYRA